ncbi:unnamed protein product [Closterium sp. NIES-53]
MTAQGITPYSWASWRLLASSSRPSRVSITLVSPTRTLGTVRLPAYKQLSPHATLPCNPRVALPCSSHTALPCRTHAALPCRPRAALPCSSRAALPCSPCAALPCSPHAALPCSPRAALPCPAPLPARPAAHALPCLRSPAARPLPCPAAITATTAAATAAATAVASDALAPLLLTATACHGHYHGRSNVCRVGAAALGASESAASAEALHTFTLDSGASRYFFRDCTIVAPLAAPVPVSLADPSGGPVVARASIVLPCPEVPSGSLSGLHLPSFLTNLVSNAVLQDVWPGSSLYTLTTAYAQVAASGQVAASSQVSAFGQFAASCSSRVLSHQTHLWHHRPGHPSLPCLHSMHSRLLVSGLPRSLPPLPRSPAPPCLPCVEGRQRAAPHSSSFPPTTAPLKTLHMDVWGPAPVGGTDQERYFLLVVDDYTCYTTVFPLRSKADVTDPDRGGEFSSRILAEFCRDQGICQTFTLLVSPQQNGIAERRISLVMEVARTSIIHTAAPHFLWPFAARYAAHQLNLCPCVSLPKTSSTLHWTGKVGNASAFRVWGALSLVCDTTASKLSPRTIRCAFMGFPADATPWQFYYPRSRRVFSSQDVTFDESVCFYRLHPHASHLVPLVPLFLVPVPPR